MKTLKKILLAVLAIFIMGGSAVAFAFWDKLTVNNAEENIVNIGQGLELVVMPVTINPVSAGTLIPASAVQKEGDTYSVVLTYTVKFDATLVEELDLAVTVTNIMVGGVANPSEVVKVAINNPGTIQNEDVVVTLTVTIDDTELTAENYDAVYAQVANKTISFDVKFAATRQA